MDVGRDPLPLHLHNDAQSLDEALPSFVHLLEPTQAFFLLLFGVQSAEGFGEGVRRRAQEENILLGEQPVFLRVCGQFPEGVGLAINHCSYPAAHIVFAQKP